MTQKDDWKNERMGVLAYAAVEYNYIEALAKKSKTPAREN